jgi:hypothetical protein
MILPLKPKNPTIDLDEEKFALGPIPSVDPAAPIGRMEPGGY